MRHCAASTLSRTSSELQKEYRVLWPCTKFGNPNFFLADPFAWKGLLGDDNAIQARQRLFAEQEETRQPLREANAKRHTKLTRAIESDALGIERRLRRAYRAYKAMLGHEA